MIPFAPASQLYARWICGISASGDVAPVPFTAATGKQLARTLIAGGQILSVPVEGGSSVLKRHRPDPALRLSQHGRWQDVHLGAWRAVYGRTPYFPHLFPELERIYRNQSFGTLADFCDSLHALACRWLGLPDIVASLREARLADPERMKTLLRQYEGKINPELSIFDPLFRYGKETVLILPTLV